MASTTDGQHTVAAKVENKIDSKIGMQLESPSTQDGLLDFVRQYYSPSFKNAVINSSRHHDLHEMSQDLRRSVPNTQKFAKNTG